jgi:hypothetical protein
VICSRHDERYGPPTDTLHESREKDLGEGVDVVEEFECDMCEWPCAPLLSGHFGLGLKDDGFGEGGEERGVDDLVVWRAVRWFDDVD